MSHPDSKKETPQEHFTKVAAPDAKHPEMKLDDLLPTQLTAGMHEVKHKQHRLHRLKSKPEKLEAFLKERPIPVVIGPGGKAYIIDHHHMALAMLHEGFDKARVEIVDDFSDAKSQAEFWKRMDEKKYVHPYDENGKRQSFDDIPKHITGLKDDPYRSLAGYAREYLGFKKVSAPFAEFQWADYFRKLIPKEEIKASFHKALRKALTVCRLPAAAHLPGYEGPKPTAASAKPA